MYYRHHSRHWLQQWFNARFLMTPLLTLVFWDLTPTGRWPLEMMKTLISCVLDNTGLLRKPWILPLQRRMWCRGCGWVGALPGHVLPPKTGAHQLHQPRVPSSQDSQVRSRACTDGFIYWTGLWTCEVSSPFQLFPQRCFPCTRTFNICPLNLFSSSKVLEFCRTV